MRLRILPIGGWVWLALAGVLSAQEPADPPARVARLNYLDGWVSFRPGNLQEWAPATLNFPLTTGDHLWADREARAELHIGATAIHLAPWTAFAIMRLDERVAQLSVAEGTMYLRIPRLDEDDVVEVDTPNGAVSVLRPGDYRVDVDPGNDATSLTVRAGEAEVSGNGRITLVHAGQMLQLVANADVAGIMDAPPPDPWEDWCVGRDRLSERALEISESYVPAEMEGAEDLGAYGDWSTDSFYGAVWAPRNPPAGWAPYRCGHWAYVAPWGWTWIDDAPWGFAPFHYGRWVQAGFRWVWAPGNRVTRPVYAPAMVVFVASGAARNGKVTAWIPLAPGEIYRPNYRASERYIRRINLPNVKNGGDVTLTVVSYLNRTHGIAVAQDTFAGARPVAAGAVPITGSVKPVTVDASPTRESYLGRRTPAEGKVAAPPPLVTERAVIVRHELPPEVRPAAPIRGAVRPPESSPLSQPPQSNLPQTERPARREEAQPEAAPLVYLALPPERPQRRAETRYEAPSQRHEETRQEAAPPPPPRHEETRHEAPPQRHEETRHEAPPQRHEETRQEAAPPPPQRHEESRHEAPAPLPQRREESRPAAQSGRNEDKKDDSSSNSSRKK